MLKTVPPTRLYPGKQIFKHSYFVLCFVKDFDAIFDSLAPLDCGETDLSQTLLYELLAICGTFLAFNEGKAKAVCWIEETRSVEISPDEKTQLLEASNDS